MSRYTISPVVQILFKENQEVNVDNQDLDFGPNLENQEVENVPNEENPEETSTIDDSPVVVLVKMRTKYWPAEVVSSTHRRSQIDRKNHC